MENVIDWLIAGVPVGCVYALVAVGLVLTYKTSGVFNLAFSGQAFLAGAVFYVLVENEGWDLWPAFFVGIGALISARHACSRARNSFALSGISAARFFDSPRSSFKL